MTLEELKKIAERATPGPWIHYDQGFEGKDSDFSIQSTSDTPVINRVPELFLTNIPPWTDEISCTINTGKFIATFNPELVTRLIKVVEINYELWDKIPCTCLLNDETHSVIAECPKCEALESGRKLLEGEK